MDIEPCTSSKGKPKKRWATPQAAQFVAEENKRMGRRAIYWYSCPTCERWHTTHLSPADAKKRRKRARWRRNVAARIDAEGENKTSQRAGIAMSAA